MMATNTSLTQSMQQNINDNSFSGHVKFIIWNLGDSVKEWAKIEFQVEENKEMH